MRNTCKSFRRNFCLNIYRNLWKTSRTYTKLQEENSKKFFLHETKQEFLKFPKDCLDGTFLAIPERTSGGSLKKIQSEIPEVIPQGTSSVIPRKHSERTPAKSMQDFHEKKSKRTFWINPDKI